MDRYASDLSAQTESSDEFEESPAASLIISRTTSQSTSTHDLDQASRRTSTSSTELDSRVSTSALERGIEHRGIVLFEKYQYSATLNRLQITLAPIDTVLRIKKRFTLACDQEAVLNEAQPNINPRFVFMATKAGSHTPQQFEMESTAISPKQRLQEVLDWRRAIYVATKLGENVLRNKITKSLNDQYETSRTTHVYQERDIANHRYSLVQKIALKTNRTEFVAKTLLVARNPALAQDKPNILSEVHVLHEAILTQVLEHPNVVKLWAVNCLFVSDNLLDYTMVFECCAGGSLDDAIHNKDKKPLDNNVFEKIMRDILSGVAFMHSKNAMHRDLKPANIGLAQNAFKHFEPNELANQNLAKIIDFGLSKDPGPIIGFVSNGIGTPLYMAPEIMNLNSNNYDSSVDLYGTGLIFYEMHARLRPYLNSYEAANQTRNHFRVQAAIVNGSLRPDTKEFPPMLRKLVQGLWQNKPMDRWKAHECIQFLDFVTKHHGGEGVFAQTSKKKVLEWSPRQRPKRTRSKKGANAGATSPKQTAPPERTSSPPVSGERIVVSAIAVGDHCVGKTALGLRFEHAFDDVDTEDYVKLKVKNYMISTNGTDYTMVTMQPINGTPTVMRLMDTAGQERFHAITTFFYRKQQICLLVYDCSNPKSVYDESGDHQNKHRLRQYYDEALLHCSSEGPLLIVILGNKRDLGDKSLNYAKTKQLVDTFMLDIQKDCDETKVIVLNPSPVSALVDGHATFQLILSDISRTFAKSMQVRSPQAANRNDANRNDANGNDANHNDANGNDANCNDANGNDANGNDANGNDANRNDANGNDANGNDDDRNDANRNDDDLSFRLAEGTLDESNAKKRSIKRRSCCRN